MSTHPNVVLIAALTPHDLSRKTMAAIRSANGATDDDDDIKISGENYHAKIMESDYDDGWQLSSKEGDLLFFDLVTYGYGEAISWVEISKRKDALEEWCKLTCQTYHCDYEIRVGANYW